MAVGQVTQLVVTYVLLLAVIGVIIRSPSLYVMVALVVIKYAALIAKNLPWVIYSANLS